METKIFHLVLHCILFPVKKFYEKNKNKCFINLQLRYHSIQRGRGSERDILKLFLSSFNTCFPELVINRINRVNDIRTDRSKDGWMNEWVEQIFYQFPTLI